MGDTSEDRVVGHGWALVRRLVVVLLVPMSWVAMDTPKASAQVQLYPWSACSYAYLQYGVGTLIPARDVTVAVNPLFPLPGDAPIDAAHDWVQNSFRSRLSEAINRWNYQIDTATSAPYWLGYLGESFTSDIQIVYGDTGPTNALGSTSRTTYQNVPCTINANEPDAAII